MGDNLFEWWLLTKLEHLCCSYHAGIWSLQTLPVLVFFKPRPPFFLLLLLFYFYFLLYPIQYFSDVDITNYRNIFIFLLYLIVCRLLLFYFIELVWLSCFIVHFF